MRRACDPNMLILRLTDGGRRRRMEKMIRLLLPSMMLALPVMPVAGGETEPGMTAAAQEVTGLYEAAKCGDAARCEQLLRDGAVADATGEYGWTPLMRAAWEGHTEAVRVLLQHGAKVSAQDAEGFTPLAAAVSRGRTEAARLLIEAGADVREKNRQGTTLLLRAGAYEDLGLVQLLVEQGADVNAASEHVGSVLHAAGRSGNKEAIRYLIQKGADAERTEGQLYVCVANNMLEDAEALLSRIGPEAAGFHGGALLNAALDNRNNAMMRVLLKGGILPNTAEDRTPLMRAAEIGDTDAIRLLLEYKASVHAQDHAGLTPLHYAAGKRQNEAMLLLIRAGAPVNITSNRGETALGAAVSTDNREGVIMLLAAGADPAADTGGMPLRDLVNRNKSISPEVRDLVLKITENKTNE